MVVESESRIALLRRQIREIDTKLVHDKKDRHPLPYSNNSHNRIADPTLSQSLQVPTVTECNQQRSPLLDAESQHPTSKLTPKRASRSAHKKRKKGKQPRPAAVKASVSFAPSREHIGVYCSRPYKKHRKDKPAPLAAKVSAFPSKGDQVESEYAASREAIKKLQLELVRERKLSRELQLQLDKREAKLRNKERLISDVRQLKEDYEALITSFKLSERIQDKQNNLIEGLRSKLSRLGIQPIPRPEQ